MMNRAVVNRAVVNRAVVNGIHGVAAYERITGHKCRQQVIGFAECVDFILETDKTNMHKGESRVKKGIFL